MDAEVWLAIGYSAFLLAVAEGLKLLARRTARRSRAPSVEREAPWPYGDAARFHYGLSRVVLLLSGFILSVMLLRHYGTYQMIPLGGALLVVALAGFGSRWSGPVPGRERDLPPG